MDQALQRPRLLSLLLLAGTHARMVKKYPTEVSQMRQKYGNKPMLRKVSSSELENCKNCAMTF